MKVEVNFKVSESAVKEFKRALSESESPTDLVRVSVEGGGCSGFMYGLGFIGADEVNAEQDVVEEYDGLKVVIDKKSLLYLDGSTVEWVDDLNQRGFKFNNPNAKKTCGCSKSFSA